MVFSLFRPRCPLNAVEKTWIEYRVSWLLKHLGTERLNLIDPVLPTGEYFPLPFHAEPDQVQQVFETVCQNMQVKPELYRVHLFDDRTEESELPPQEKWLEWETGVAFPYYEGVLYEPHGEKGKTGENGLIATLHIHADIAVDLERLIAILAQALAQFYMVSLPGLEMDEVEQRHTSELMPLCFGLGIFGANAVLRQREENHLGWHFWSMMPNGSLPARYYGYAFALLSWVRDAPLPAWRSHLRRDAEESFRASLRFLEKTGDAVLDREPSSKPYVERPLSQWLEDLRQSTPSRRVAALWAIESKPEGIQPGDDVALIAENLSHGDPIVRAEAARTLDRLGETAVQAVPDLLIALDDRQGSVRIMAALALGNMPSQAEQILPELMPVLRDDNINVANATAWAVGQFGHRAEDAGPLLVHLLRRAILRCTKESLEDILDALLAVTDHPEEVITDTLIERDTESCQRALDLLKEHQIDQLAAKP